MKNSILHSIKIGVSTLILSLVFSTTSFSQDLIPSDWPNLVGYWKFQDTTDLTKATVGNDLILIGQHQWLPGAFYGDTAIRIDTGNYYKVYHGISANGGGDSVNQYTLMYDFRVLSFNHWHCFQQTDTTNQNDADCFIKPIPDSLPGMIGVGFTGYSDTSIVPNQWYRLVISVNLGHFYNYYLNGVLIHTGDTDEIQIDDRFALTEAILFFADNNQEDDTIDVGSIALFDTCLSPSQIAQIGTLDPCIENPPTVDLGKDTMICFSDSITLNAGSGYKSYLWSTGDTTAEITAWRDTTVMVFYDTIWVRITDMNDCEASDTINVFYPVCEGFDEYQKVETKLFPNPSSGNLNIELFDNAIRIRIYNTTGKEVAQFINMHKGMHSINLTMLPEGLYIMEVQGEKGKSYSKIIIQR